MSSSHTHRLAAVLFAACVVTACRSAGSAAPPPGSPPPPPPPRSPSPDSTSAAQGEAAAIAQARADSLRHPYTEADIQFMTGMISHHAQAIVMAGWAPSHGASPSVRTLCARIVNAQRDEIVTMQRWLRDRRQPVPDPSQGMQMSRMHGMQMPGMTMAMDSSGHGMLMPGMLTPAQMKQLDEARGAEFDRLFLTFMIQHHRGAVSMVKQLFETYGAAQDETVFKFASDVNVDQTTEIARMQKMLLALTLDSSAP
ncbi:MAG TPA: DUF305 domain-containing protein [Gemmatimonadaceae bacterium]